MPVNNAEKPSITKSYQESLAELSECLRTQQPEPGPFELRPKFPVEVGDLLAHIYEDVHEILRRLDRFEREARPLLDAYKRTNGGTIGLFKARKELRGGS